MSRIEDPRPSHPEERTQGLVLVLQQLWTYSITTKSDVAREFADEIAEAASRGFITTVVIPEGRMYGRLWKLTPAGLTFLWQHTDCITNEEIDYAANYASQA